LGEGTASKLKQFQRPERGQNKKSGQEKKLRGLLQLATRAVSPERKKPEKKTCKQSKNRSDYSGALFGGDNKEGGRY